VQAHQILARHGEQAEGIGVAQVGLHRERGFAADCRTYSAFWRTSAALLSRLPPPARREDRDRVAALTVQTAARASRARFLHAHADAVYDKLTARRSRFVRLEQLAADAAKSFPGLVPSAREIAAEEGLRQSEKAGLEIDQGLFISAVLRSPRAGTHLCHAMLLPRDEAADAMPRFLREDRLELPGASIERKGKAAILTYRNPRFLNAEDQTTLDGFETCVDIALLDPRIEIAAIRGGAVEHSKYAGRRAFGSGINLTHLYHGRIPFLWYLTRDLGYVNKLYRGIAMRDGPPPDEFGGAHRGEAVHRRGRDPSPSAGTARCCSPSTT
jgi:(3,5-dihydroxyphenyl)acetyl-CoA 1,2-dioxygenase